MRGKTGRDSGQVQRVTSPVNVSSRSRVKFIKRWRFFDAAVASRAKSRRIFCRTIRHGRCIFSYIMSHVLSLSLSLSLSLCVASAGASSTAWLEKTFYIMLTYARNGLAANAERESLTKNFSPGSRRNNAILRERLLLVCFGLVRLFHLVASSLTVLLGFHETRYTCHAGEIRHSAC